MGEGTWSNAQPKNFFSVHTCSCHHVFWYFSLLVETNEKERRGLKEEIQNLFTYMCVVPVPKCLETILLGLAFFFSLGSWTWFTFSSIYGITATEDTDPFDRSHRPCFLSLLSLSVCLKSIGVLRLLCVCVALRCLFIYLIAAYFCQTWPHKSTRRKRCAIEWDWILR